jgi:uncharacterized protein involved in response to NO
VLSALVFTAAVLRVTASFVTSDFFQLLALAALAWVGALIVWAATFAPRLMRVARTGD